MKDADSSARLRIAPDGDTMIVTVVLGDGRTTSRRVRSPDALPITIEALTAIPLVTATPLAPAPTNPALPVAPVSEPAPPAPSVSPAPAAEKHALSIELGALATGRVARAPTYLSAGLSGYAGLRVRDWLLGLTLRWDPFEVLVSGTPPKDLDMESLGAGFFLANSVLASPAFGLDVGASALVLAEKQSFSAATQEHAVVESDARLGVFSRLSLGRDHWRWAISIDAEVSPLRVRRARRIEPLAPTLQTWSLGLGLGTTWRDL